eukprot:gnl/TRDRNA2_/TRDRNA2_148381_c2_seq1.p1 gnl/TRDRNA2_/TRDRNA2_148381_c2~~gnl/TRDRNA2_/TRDRNA2_148381_c2_seq1.p1  ORF type:complete len:182 (-),score=20.14 gnl/TRDRNA2_/TRDRNA2_148381_c2_seq1:168-659(-)
MSPSDQRCGQIKGLSVFDGFRVPIESVIYRLDELCRTICRGPGASLQALTPGPVHAPHGAQSERYQAQTAYYIITVADVDGDVVRQEWTAWARARRNRIKSLWVASAESHEVLVETTNPVKLLSIYHSTRAGNYQSSPFQLVHASCKAAQHTLPRSQEDVQQR